MKSLGFLLSLIFIIASCAEEVVVPPPENVIPRDSMKLVLTEMMLTANAIEVRHQHLPKFYKISKASGEAVLKKYGLSNERYLESLTYYQTQLKDLEVMYQEMLDSLNHLNR